MRATGRSLGALEPEPAADDLAAIAAALPPEEVTGARYDAQQPAILDSER